MYQKIRDTITTAAEQTLPKLKTQGGPKKRKVSQKTKDLYKRRANLQNPTKEERKEHTVCETHTHSLPNEMYRENKCRGTERNAEREGERERDREIQIEEQVPTDRENTDREKCREM